MFSNWNIKKVVIWLLVIMVSSFGIAGLIFISEGNQGWTGFVNDGEHNEANKIDIEKEVSINNLTEIGVIAVSSDVTVTPYDGNVIKVHFYGNSSRTTNLPELIIDESGKNVRIEIKHSPGLNFSLGMVSERFYLDIQVPNNYSEDMNIKNVSGKIEVKDINVRSLNMHSVSGALKGTKINVSEDVVLETTSGKIQFGEVAGRIRAESVSGAIDITQNKPKDDITLKTISGKIILQIPSSSEFMYKFKSTSGKIVNEFRDSDKTRGSVEGTVGKGGLSINAQTVSGNFELRKE